MKKNNKKRVLTIMANVGGYDEKAQQRTRAIFDSIKNFLELLKVDYTSDYIEYQTEQFILNIDDYEYMLILQCLRLSELHFEFE